jgi:CHAD domain-containing protein
MALWRPFRRVLSLIIEVDPEIERSDSASLFGEANSTLDYGSITNKVHVVQEDPRLSDRICCCKRNSPGIASVSLVLPLAALVLLTTLAVLLGQPPARSNPALNPNVLLLSDFVYAPDVAGPSTTFSELAHFMLPAWYAMTLNEMPVFTSKVMPGQVERSRKIMLKTRDLLDVFSPVYHNETGNMWESIRHHLDKGYTIVGEFQDLHNAHVRYHNDQLRDLRNKVLKWKRHFDAFRKKHDAMLYLAAPASKGGFRHKESHLFWDSLEKRIQGTDPASDCLRLLGSNQLERSLSYLRDISKFTSVLDETYHAEYHNLRKQLRSVVDEFELFAGVMFPLQSDTYSSIETLITARKLLGHINDDWTAYSIYVKRDEYHSEQKRLAHRIESAWTNFKTWTDDVDFEGTLRRLAQNMTATLPEPSSKS